MKEWEQKRPQYQQFKEVEQSQPWFKVYDIGFDTYAIYEPYHFQEVISYLIMGSEKALLWDTGLGIGDMKKLVEELWDKDYEVVNSHRHFDHIGDNYQFENVFVYDHPQMIQAMTVPLADSYVGPEYAEDQFSDDAPIKEFTYVWHPISYTPIHEGHQFDLGNRCFTVIHTPGHAADAIMLDSPEEKVLFTGDTYYPAPMYCFEDTFPTYVETMQMLSDKYSDYTLITSHNEPIRMGSIFKPIAEGFKKIQNNEMTPVADLGARVMYETEDFALIKKK